MLSWYIQLQRFFRSDVETYIDSKATEIGDKISEFTYKGVYSSTVLYKRFNTVLYNNEAYVCLVENKGHTPAEPAYWNKIAARGEKGDSGTGLTFRGNYDAIQRYTKDDCVTDNVRLWAALKASKGQPLVEGEYWTVAIVLNTTNKHTATSITLLSNKWIGNQQMISLSAVGADSTIIVSAAVGNLENYVGAGITCIAQSAGGLTFTCQTAPTVDVSVNIIIMPQGS